MTDERTNSQTGNGSAPGEAPRSAVPVRDPQKIAEEANPLIGLFTEDTLGKVDAALTYLGCTRIMDGLVPDDDYEWGQALYLDTIQSALRHETKRLEEGRGPAKMKRKEEQ